MSEVKCHHITRSEQKIAKTRAHKLISDVRKKLLGYKFEHRLVGSGAWGTMVSDQTGEYDLDYQIEITKNSKEYKKDNIGFKNVKKIKMDFIEAFKECSLDGETFEDSTTAITLINDNKSKSYHIDFVIVFYFDDTHPSIIRKNNKDQTYTWNQLKYKNKEIYSQFELLGPLEKEALINEVIIPKKCKEKFNPTGKSSYEIFLSEVNNYVKCKGKDNRL